MPINATSFGEHANYGLSFILNMPNSQSSIINYFFLKAMITAHSLAAPLIILSVGRAVENHASKKLSSRYFLHDSMIDVFGA